MERPRAEPDDDFLLARIAAGNLDSFRCFYDRHVGRVLSYARQLCRGPELAEDLAQDVFVAVWCKAGSFRSDRGDVAGWLYTLTRNKVVDHWRKLDPGAEVAGLDLGSLPGSREDGVDLQLAIRQALAWIQPEQRRAIEMAYFGGLTYEETAARLKLPVGTLKSRIRSGLKLMRSLLAPREKLDASA
ncbi:MAG TPA: sigma-70 family RNA polymerase sigma factor [Thermoanaerobaculia bacterium]|nr:sigma-70 family RNA polymerase sigma factor [Thermoanaerobaculia bacterium]